MTLEHLSLRQHGLTVTLLAALWATACGGTFSGGSGGAGGAGAGSGGMGAGGSQAGAGGLACYGDCPLIACNGVPRMEPGACCPVCEPNGGSGGMSSGGGAGVGGCGDVACNDIGCGPGWISVYEPGACCPSCVPDGSAGAGGGGGCLGIACPAIACAKGYKTVQNPGDCCPTCVPDDACSMGQQNYNTLRQMLLAQPGAVACKIDNDCSLLGGNAYCGDECSQVPVNAAAAQSIEAQLSSFAMGNCSTCTPEYPPCAAPLPPICAQGQCVVGGVD